MHNERRAGPKTIATKEVVERALELHDQGISQEKIVEQLFNEFGLKIGRTTIGEMVRGNYVLPDEK